VESLEDCGMRVSAKHAVSKMRHNPEASELLHKGQQFVIWSKAICRLIECSA
jgi:hypothetical protein